MIIVYIGVKWSRFEAMGIKQEGKDRVKCEGVSCGIGWLGYKGWV